MSLSRTATSGLLLILIALVGCVRRAGRNPDCNWPGEPAARTNDASKRSSERHLREDVEFAQELAVEYMDAHFGPRSSEFKSRQTANEALNACLGTLILQIAKTHDLPPQAVAGFLDRRSMATDFAVSMPFILLYGFLAGMMIDRTRGRYPPADGWTAALVMFILSALVFAVGGMMVGEQWSTLVENVRVGTGHLSYRVDRLPWIRHEFDFFVFYLVLFCGIAAVRLRRQPESASR